MELVQTENFENSVINTNQIITKQNSGFIEANTIEVSLEHLKNECTIPVFSKDNEMTISHYSFINKTYEIAKKYFGEEHVYKPNIRVSHSIKGRVPSAIGKPAKELLEHEKTLYYERCAFLIEIKSNETINENSLTLSIGGVRSYNQENLYSKKSVEKFKIFIGFKNKVCTNLCISTDGFSNEIRISSILELEKNAINLFSNYDKIGHLSKLENLAKFSLNEQQFAHLIGKLRMYNHLDKTEQKSKFPFLLNDGQLNNVVKEYFQCPNFSREHDRTINLWKLYNLFTEANKSSYIDSNLERNVNVYEFINTLSKSLQNQETNWFLQYVNS
jgi:hypothetical protein